MRVRIRHDRLARELAKRNRTQNRWAQTLGISRSYLSMLMHGKRPYPSPRTREKLLDGLGLRFDELFSMDQLPHRVPSRQGPDNGPPSRTVGRSLTGGLLHSMRQDFAYGLRMLWKNPGFSSVAVLTLALGIGANSSLFSAVQAVLIRPLPYYEPERLMTVWETFIEQGNARNTVTPSNFTEWRASSTGFEEMVAYTTGAVSLTEAGEPLKVVALYSSDAFLKLFGVEPILGRAFEPGEISKPGELTVLVISHSLWRSHFGEDPQVIDRTVRIDGHPVTILGVMPPSFTFPNSGVDLWIPTRMGESVAGQKQAHYLRVLGRLNHGVTLRRAQEELSAVAQELRGLYPETNGGIGVEIVPLHEQQVGDVRPALLILLGATGLVLLIACVNVSSLFLARADARRKEIALRLALGSGRWRVVRQLLTESALLSLLGGAAGLLLSTWGVPLLVAFAPANLALSNSAGIDSGVLLFTLAATFATALLFGAAPAFQTARSSPRQVLNEGVRGGSTSAGGWAQRILVVSEVALAVVLLTGGGLLLNSLARLNGVEPGFPIGDLLTLEVQPPNSKYPDTGRRTAFYQEALRRVESLPGVESAGFVTIVPPKGLGGHMTYITEQDEGEKVVAGMPRTADAGYFRTLSLLPLAGRNFGPQDQPTAPLVAIINETFAKSAWPGHHPIGKRLKMGVHTQPWLTVVGLIRDVRFQLSDPPLAQVYLPYSQSAHYAPNDLVMRTRSPAAPLATQVRQEVWQIDPDQPVANLATMEQLYEQAIQGPRFNALLLNAFSFLALVLAAVGIYGVTSYSVSRSRRQIGIRIALGAQKRDVLRMVLGQGSGMALTGVVVGMAAAWGMTRWMSTLLYEITPTDPLTFLSVPMLLAPVALVACYIPAQRAARVNPIEVLVE